MTWKKSLAEAADLFLNFSSTTLVKLVSDGTRQFYTYFGGKHVQSMFSSSL